MRLGGKDKGKGEMEYFRYEMRNTTMLKHLLLKYTVSLDMDEDEIFQLTLIDKRNHTTQTLEGNSYSIVIRKAHSFLLQELKNKN